MAEQLGSGSWPVSYETFESTPGVFDPRTASDELLNRYGLPSRPDARERPAFASAWERAFSRPARFVGAVLSKAGRVGRSRAEFGATAPWAGAVMGANPPDDPFDWVFAQWVVPAVLALAQDANTETVGFWVGLDGWNEEADQILQAGIAADVSPDGVAWRAWTEWMPADPKTIDGFPIASGDVVSFFVWGDQSSPGTVVVQNLSVGQAAVVRVKPPAPLLSRHRRIHDIGDRPQRLANLQPTVRGLHRPDLRSQ
jgi:hypothetical protein